jgi:hypothetical protein
MPKNKNKKRGKCQIPKTDEKGEKEDLLADRRVASTTQQGDPSLLC